MSSIILEILDKKQNFIKQWCINPNIIIIGSIDYYKLVTYFNERITSIYDMKIIEDIYINNGITIAFDSESKYNIELNNETTNVRQIISKEEIVKIIKANILCKNCWSIAEAECIEPSGYKLINNYENIAEKILEKIEKNNGGK